jgi:hypothetical protein
MAGSRRAFKTIDGPLAEAVDHVSYYGIASFSKSSMQHRIGELIRIATLVAPQNLRSASADRLLDHLLDLAIEELKHPAESAAAPYDFGLYRTCLKKYDRNTRHSLAAEKYGQASGYKDGYVRDTYRKDEYQRALIVNVGHAIESIELVHREARLITLAKPAANNTRYVSRPRLEAIFESALGSSAGIIALTGLPGTGKTRIVEQLLTQGDRISRQFKCDRTLATTLTRVLREFGIYDQLPSNEKNVATIFATLAHSQSAPNFIVLDNLTDTSILDDLDIMRMKSTVIVTSNYPLSHSHDMTAIHIGPMDLQEALDMARNLLPGVAESDLRLLVKTADLLPGTIEVLANLAHDAASPEKLRSICHLFSDNPAVVIRDSNGELLAQYSDILANLNQRHPVAAEVLLHMSHLARVVSLETIVAAMADFHDIRQESILGFSELVARNLNELQVQSYVTTDNDVVGLTRSVRGVLRYFVKVRHNTKTATHLRKFLIEQLRLAAQDQETIHDFMDKARHLVNYLLHVEYSQAGSRDEAERRVAAIVDEAFKGYTYGKLVSISRLLDADSGDGTMLMHKLTFELDTPKSGDVLRRQIENFLDTLPTEAVTD